MNEYEIFFSTFISLTLQVIPLGIALGIFAYILGNVRDYSYMRRRDQ
jgi:hypothetical protein